MDNITQRSPSEKRAYYLKIGTILTQYLVFFDGGFLALYLSSYMSEVWLWRIIFASMSLILLWIILSLLAPYLENMKINLAKIMNENFTIEMKSMYLLSILISLLLAIGLKFFVNINNQIINNIVNLLPFIALLVLIVISRSKSKQASAQIGAKVLEVNNFTNWNLNAWGSNFCRFEGHKLLFSGTGPQDRDVAWKDFNQLLEINKTYFIEAQIEYDPDDKNYDSYSYPEDAKIEIWVHDNMLSDPNWRGPSETSHFPSKERTQKLSLNFTAKQIRDIRIHFRFYKGKGIYKVSWLKIKKL